MSAVVEVRGLTAGYEGVPVVRELDLRVEPAEIVALLGPNGAGKTTTLLTIAGLLAPIGGEVSVLGARVPAGRPQAVARRGLAFIPEDRGLFAGLTVSENLRLARRRGGPVTPDPLAHFPALGPLRDRRAGLLSGGEQQMLAIARALVARPRVLMIDELSLGLAPIVVEQMLPVLRGIAEDGTSVLLVEQHVHLALEWSDRAYVLSHGDLVLEGRSSDLVDRHDLLEVSYLGDEAL